MKTSVYIDGFNLYYGCFRSRERGQRPRCSSTDKWLNLRALANYLVGAGHSVHQVHYFTANVHRSLRDPEQNLRQQTYLRALRTVPSVHIHLGSHIPVERRGLIIDPDPASLGLWRDQIVGVRLFEEKGSDVNLATRLLDDSYERVIERAIVVSNDTDLIAPIVSARRRIRVSIVSPQTTVAKRLKKVAETATLLDVSLLAHCHLDIPVYELDGSAVFPPRSWLTSESQQPVDSAPERE